MVSTRSVRYKFSEGERVLCYEPDPTKAKVLYDSKVLEVIESKDKRGRRTVEYLIHFQGWNSSWDRCVSEDFVLKDTEENRQLQRDLAEKSQLQLGAYLYRRERKKGNSTSSAGPAKRPRHGFSDDGSSSNSQPDGNGYSEVDTPDTDSSSGSASSTQPSSPGNSHSGRASIALPSALRDRLTFDYHLVVKRGRLSRLPATPCAAQILESYVKWFARAGAWNPPRARHDPPHKPDMLDVSCRLNLLREVADGLRVYFDFVLRTHLLYQQEHDQYNEMCGRYVDEPDIKSEPEDDDESQSQDEEELDQKMDFPDRPHKENGDTNESHDNNDEDEEVDVDDVKEEYDDKIPKSEPLSDDGSVENDADQNDGDARDPDDGDARDPDDGDARDQDDGDADDQNDGEQHVEHDGDQHGQHDDHPHAHPDGDQPHHDCGHHSQSDQILRERHERELLAYYAAPRGRSLARRLRLRSRKSVISQLEYEEPAPSTSAGEQRTFETLSSSVGSSGSSLCESWRARSAPPAAATHHRTPLSLLLDKVAKWQIIPREDTEHLPCRVYGAIHLARLFVKLPDFLNATQMPDFKLKLVLKHVDMFIQYLEEHSEWFGEMFYVGDGVSPSH